MRLGAAAVQRGVFRRYVIPPFIGLSVTTSVQGRAVDAYLCSYSRSGRTWMTFCLANYMRQLYSSGPEVTFGSYFRYVPDADRPIDDPLGGGAFNFLDRNDVPFVLRSHAPYRKDRFPGRVVLVLRDPRDILVSHYHYLTKNERVTNCDFRTFLHGNTDLATNGVPSGLHAISRHLDSWARPVLEGQIAVTSYETWRTAPEAGLTQLLATFGLPVEENLVAIACERSQETRMRQSEATPGNLSAAETRKEPDPSERNSYFVRRASVGGWRTELNAKEQEELLRVLSRRLTTRTKAMFRHLGLPYELS